MLSSYTLALLALIPFVASHAAEAPYTFRSEAVVARRALEARCGKHLQAKRQLRADAHLAKRQMGAIGRRATNSTGTCLLQGEVTQGPYHILGELVRQNITEGQAGVPLQVSVDFIDVSTCEGVQVWVDAWHANSTGYYSGYTASTGSSVGGSTGGAPSSSNDTSSMGGAGASGSVSMGAAPSGSAGGGGGIGGGSTTNSSDITATSGADSAGDTTSAPTDQETFLRGAWLSDSDGHLDMYSVFPGWYSGRAQHFHIKAYDAANAYQAANGSFIVTADAVHTGQFFFDNATLNAVANTSIYSANSIAWADHVSNEEDTWYPYEDANGNSADMEISWVDDNDIMAGLIGQITVGINMTFDSNEISSQYASYNVTEYSIEGLLPTATLSVGASTSPAAYSVSAEAAKTSTGSTTSSGATVLDASASSSATSSTSAGRRFAEIPSLMKMIVGRL